MGLLSSGRTWDEAASPSSARLVRQFEADWRASRPGRRPCPEDYLDPPVTSDSGAWFALLRAEMGLRHEEGQPVRAEDWIGRHPSLSDEARVGLIYEELCLREEAGQTPDPSEFFTRFPDLTGPLRRVLDIHDLVGSGPTTIAHLPETTTAAFPETGQTIAGFHLVEELGRGSFARVFRAEERTLADRPVALKVTRAESREPQTLARLQHTHIVPVHSYRTDPATGLHLLCMPYLGGVTLARLLADPAVRGAATGADLLGALDRLEPSAGGPPGRSVARQALARRSYVRAVAWWGARMAEALQHAHERGVLHRDVKPSNVLVTGDGSPLLLDFNLAWERRLGDPGVEPGALGGTLAYMAPEHIESLVGKDAGAVDARADLYALGVVLFEAMGARPFPPPPSGTSILHSLHRAAAQRRGAIPHLRAINPEVTPEFEAVVRRCLAPDPADRYGVAADLAADLQAVADDAPLRSAHEPLPSRTRRWLRRNRMRLSVTVPLALAPAVVVYGLAAANLERARTVGRLSGEAKRLIADGRRLTEEDRLDLAEAKFNTAAELASGRADDELAALRGLARERLALAGEAKRLRSVADNLFDQGDRIRFDLLGSTAPAGDPSRAIEEALRPFYVLEEPDWTRRADLTLLDPRRRERLRAEVDDLLFLWALALDRSGETARGAEICAKGGASSADPGPWRALSARLSGRSLGAEGIDAPTSEGSARACFHWGLLRAREGSRRAAIAWLERASRLAPDDYWSHFVLAYQYQAPSPERDAEQALAHLNVAVALRPESPWAKFNRARLNLEAGSYGRALEDLQAALEGAEGGSRAPVLLNLGLVHQALGDLPAARASYGAILEAPDVSDPYRRAARLNRARLEIEAGSPRRALAEYESLLAGPGDDPSAREGRAWVALRLGQTDRAEADLSLLLASDPDNARLLRERALTRVAMGRADLAEADVTRALEVDPTPALERLATRVRIALGRERDLDLARPRELRDLPGPRASLWTDLDAASDRLDAAARHGDARAARNRAVILSALGRPHDAMAQADRAVALAGSPRALLIRARVRLQAGDLRGASDDVARGLEAEPDDPRFLAVRGRILRARGDVAAGLADFDRAMRRGAEGTIHPDRAEALMALGRYERAVAEWSRASTADPEDPRPFLGRARAFLALGQIDQALADLERAASWAGDRPDVLARIAVQYTRCLPGRPDRLPRVAALVRRIAGALAVASRP